MAEVWAPIPGFEGKYEASTEGRIRSLDRLVPNGTRVRRLVGRVLKPAAGRSGHLSVVLGRSGGTTSVHKAVALTFLGPRPEGMEVLHSDHNPANNRLENLRYGTRSENLLDDYASGAQRRQFPVTAVEPDGSRHRFRSVTHAARHYGLNQSAVTLAIQQGYPTRKLKVRFEKCSLTA